MLITLGYFTFLYLLFTVSRSVTLYHSWNTLCLTVLHCHMNNMCHMYNLLEKILTISSAYASDQTFSLFITTSPVCLLFIFFSSLSCTTRIMSSSKDILVLILSSSKFFPIVSYLLLFYFWFSNIFHPSSFLTSYLFPSFPWSYSIFLYLPCWKLLLDPQKRHIASLLLSVLPC